MSKLQVYSTSDTNLLMADTLLTIVVSALLIHSNFGIHAAISIILGIVIAVALNVFFMTKVGYWVVSVVFSLIWATLGGGLVGAFTKSDKVWMWCAGGVLFLICLMKHGLAKRYNENVEEV